MIALSIIVTQPQNSPDLAPMVEDLTFRHADHDVQPSYYEPVGVTLFKMMEEMLSDELTCEME